MSDDQTKLYIAEKLQRERENSDTRYAVKLVERIVFGAMGFIAVAVLGALVALVIKQ